MKYNEKSLVNQGGAATSSCVSQNTVGSIRVSESLPHTSFKGQIIICKLQLYYKEIKTPSLNVRMLKRDKTASRWTCHREDRRQSQTTAEGFPRLHSGISKEGGKKRRAAHKKLWLESKHCLSSCNLAFFFKAWLNKVKRLAEVIAVCM